MDFDEAVEEFDVDDEILEEVDVELEHESSGVDFESKEITVIQPFEPGEGVVQENHLKKVVDGNELSVRIKHRPRCDCGHVVAEAGGRNQLLADCQKDGCGRKVCDRCESVCAACGEPMCPDCTSGHGLEDETYCGECRMDVEEDVEFAREMDEREQRHKEQLDRRKQELKEEKERAKLELQELKTDREQIRQDWKTIIHAINALSEDSEDNEGKKSDVDSFGGSGAFSGSGAFTGDKEYSSGSSEPDWLKEAENDIDETL